MPVALERELKAKVAKKKMSKERKDAYVYGTLRKTGWKPEREKKMSDTSETVNFAEVPNVGSSLERLKGIVAKGRNPMIRNEVAERHFRRTKLFGITKPWDRPTLAATAGKSVPGMSWVETAKKAPFQSSGFGPRLLNATSKLVRLSEINNGVESLIQFRSTLDTAEDVAAGGALTAGGYGAYRLHKRIQKAGGYGEARQQLGIGYGVGKAGGAEVPLGEAWKGLRKGFKKSPGAAIGSALGILRSKIHLESEEKPIEFASVPSYWAGGALRTGAKDLVSIKRFAGLRPTTAGGLANYGNKIRDYMREAAKRKSSGIANIPPPQFSDSSKPIEFDASILGPWHGPTGHTSKIDQLEFPAGLSPAAALKFQLPVLMRYLNQRNLLQQQFSRKERLVQLSAKLDEINA